MKKKKDRSAIFDCSLTIKKTNGSFLTSSGKLKGKISYQIKGKKGFGYDPIFIPNGKKTTFGQMQKKKKILMDHRFLAFKNLKKKIKTL